MFDYTSMNTSMMLVLYMLTHNEKQILDSTYRLMQAALLYCPQDDRHNFLPSLPGTFNEFATGIKRDLPKVLPERALIDVVANDDGKYVKIARTAKWNDEVNEAMIELLPLVINRSDTANAYRNFCMQYLHLALAARDYAAKRSGKEISLSCN